MTETQSQKTQLRTELRQARQQPGAEWRAQASAAIARHCQQHPDWNRATRIALYLAADAEADPAALASAARAAGKELYLPVIKPDDSLSFARWQEGATLQPNRYGIPEPSGDSPVCPTAQLDLIFLPLVGWDRSGTRLGMGGGFYDRSLAGIEGPARIGFAFGLQERETLPAQPWDARLDYVATEAALVDCRGSN